MRGVGVVHACDILSVSKKGVWAVKTVLTMVLVAMVAGFGAAARAQGAEGKAEPGRLRVGVFDSRAVAVAYAGSEGFNQRIKRLMEEKRQAEAAGDQERVKRLEAEGKAQQAQLHQQGFGTASVANILETIKDQLPTIAREAGVDVIVSKWDVVYQTPSAELVDVTEAMLKPFHPNERVRKTVKELQQHRPLSAEELRNLRD
jgi:Skp family chaperone for outer membrane proteins